MAPVIVKPTVALGRGDTFVFGSWVCVSNGAGSFNRFLAATPKTLAETFLQAATDDLAENFDEISLSDPIREPELKTHYNSALTQAWIELFESTPNSHGPIHLPPPMPFGLRSASAAYQAALPKLQRLGKEATLEYYSDSEIIPDYYSDSEIIPDYYSQSSDYELDYGSDEYEEKLLTGSAQGLVITSTPAGRFVYWPDQKPSDLAVDNNSRLVACLDNLPYQEGSPLQDEGSDTELVTPSTSGDYLPSREIFVVDTPEGHRQNQRFPEDVTDDELSANAPTDETLAQKIDRWERNAGHAVRR
ncbi:unnamed protein product [Urochloa humidicola]